MKEYCPYFMLHHSATQWPGCKNTNYFVPTEHTAMPNFGKRCINPFIAFRRSSKVFIAIKTLNAKLGKIGQILGALSHP